MIFIAAYPAYFVKKIGDKNLNEINKIFNSKLDRTILSNDKLNTIVRKSFYEYRKEYQEKFHNTQSIDDKMCNYIRYFWPSVKSILTFNDLDHCNIPIYKDEGFLVYEKLHESKHSKTL